jgi:hypothetical protein
MLDIKNGTDLPSSYFEDVVRAAAWPDEARLLLDPGSTSLGPCDYGAAFWHGHRAHSEGIEGLWHWPNWDCAVVIASRTTDWFARYPEFVTWIIGHELGHARLAIQDLEAYNLCRFVGEALRSVISDWRYLPDERLCDQFALHVAEGVHSRDVAHAALQDLAREVEPAEGQRIRATLAQPAIRDIVDVRPSLREVGAANEARLRAAWTDDLARGPRSYCSGIDSTALF